MDGLMMQFPLTLLHIFDRAARYFAGTEVVLLVDPPLAFFVVRVEPPTAEEAVLPAAVSAPAAVVVVDSSACSPIARFVMWRRLLPLVLAIALSSIPLRAQHDYTPADVEDGGRLFRGRDSCHNRPPKQSGEDAS